MRWSRARPTAPTAFRSPSSPGFRRRSSSGRARCSPGSKPRARAARSNSLPLFSYEPREPPQPPAPDELRAAVAALDPDALSPREALEAIYALKRLMEAKAK